MAVQKTMVVRIDEINLKRLKSLEKVSKLRLKVPKLVNLAVEKGLPELVKELAR